MYSTLTLKYNLLIQILSLQNKLLNRVFLNTYCIIDCPLNRLLKTHTHTLTRTKDTIATQRYSNKTDKTIYHEEPTKLNTNILTQRSYMFFFKFILYNLTFGQLIFSYAILKYCVILNKTLFLIF